MKALDRGLQMNARRDRIAREQLAHDVQKLQGPTLLDLALQDIARRRLELETQLEEGVDQCRHWRQEIAWLDEQRDELIAQAAAERKR